tara:strand:- start:1655 stop:1849 length:195 start_codon:yes stop_codon:yes gene_type:complete
MEINMKIIIPEIILSKNMKEILLLVGSDFNKTPEFPHRKADTKANISPVANINIGNSLVLQGYP